MEVLVSDRKKHIIFRESFGLLVAAHRTNGNDTTALLGKAKLNLVNFESVMKKLQEYPKVINDIFGTFHVMPQDVKNIQGLYRLENNVLINGAGSKNNTIYINHGNGSSMLMIEVHGDRATDFLDRRFTLYPKDGSDMIADRIVGVKNEGEFTPMRILPPQSQSQSGSAEFYLHR